MIYFTSDLHLGHTNVIKYCNRPFKDSEEMDKIIINNINSKVRENDELYILGDICFSFSKGKDTLKNILNQNIFLYTNRIKCKHIHLIKGNHDISYNTLIKLNEEQKMFDSISQYKEIKYNKRLIVVCHYPFADNSWNKAMYGSINLHGHIHSIKQYNLENRKKGILKYDVGVDANDYYPVLLDDILNFFKDVDKSKNIKDYHKH